MRILQIAACIFCIWLIFFRQEARARFLCRPLGMVDAFSSCDGLRSLNDDNPFYNKEGVMRVVERSGVYGQNVEGTTVYILAVPGWTQCQAQRANEKLNKAVADIQKVPSANMRLIDEPCTYNQPLRWQLLVAVLGAVLVGIARLVIRLRC